MKICMGAVAGLAAAWTVAGAQTAGATTASRAFGVSATAVAACTVAPQPWTAGPVCQRQAGAAIRPPAAPLVRFSRDPETGAVVQTVEF